MEKLIKKLEEFLNPMKISKEGIEYWDFTNNNSTLPLAEEVKKLALAFANYQENSQYDEDKYMPQEALFNKFLDEYYK